MYMIDEDIEDHVIGDTDCNCGACGIHNYPFPKQCDCGGLIHAEWWEDMPDGDHSFMTKCDKCGRKEEEWYG